MRDGLSLLDQAIAYGAGAVRADEVRAMLGTIERARVFALLDAVQANDGARLMSEIGTLSEFSPDFGGVLDDIAGALHRVQLKQLVATHELEDRGDEAAVASLAQALPAEEVQLLYQIAINGRRDLSLAPTPRAGFEMTMLRMLAFRPADAAIASLAAGFDAARPRRRRLSRNAPNLHRASPSRHRRRLRRRRPRHRRKPSRFAKPLRRRLHSMATGPISSVRPDSAVRPAYWRATRR